MEFKPPRWLANRHLQSMLASMSVRRRSTEQFASPVVAAQKQMLLDCGDGVRLECFHSAPAVSSGRAAVVLHGWEGSAQSIYVLSLSQMLFERGFDVVRLNLRDHGETHHLNRELFHSCRLPELIGAVRSLQDMFAGRPMNLVGFSLGGNFVLRVAARAAHAQLDLARVIAISPVLDPCATLVALERALPGYQLYFIRKWMRSLLKKQAAWPQVYDFREMGRLSNLRRMTAELVRRFTEFPSLDEYLNGYSIVGDALASLAVPAHIITALDDPIIPAGDLSRLASSTSLKVTVTHRGGHCGFLDRLYGPSWVEHRIIDELDVAATWPA
jgi:predicted alpha/beta-fold hydrolase